MTAVAKLATRMSVHEFLGWEPRDGLRYELVDGQPRAMAPASTVHGYLQSELGRLIGNHLREHRPGCHVITNPGVVPNLLSAHNFRIPDLGVTCAPVTPGQASMPDPVLLVEILSPSNQADSWSNFSKKEAKSSCISAASLSGRRTPISKSFLVLFFKKELLPSFLRS